MPSLMNHNNIWGSTGHGRAVLIAYGLGAAVGLGFALSKLSFAFVDLGLYLIALSIFHLWEYMYMCIYHPTDVTTDSFMVNHSMAFNIAMVASFVEYIFEWYYFPSLKGNWPIYTLGFLLVLGGQLLRTIAMMTAGHNFNHYIAQKKEPDHVLVTYGGWFVWSVATQIMIFNPISIIAFAYASWVFFKTRVTFEETTLVSHFGGAYKKYQKEVPSGIPLVK